MKRVFVYTVASLLLLAAPVAAQDLVSASPDVTIDLGAGVITADEDVAVDNQLGIVVLENLGSIPEASDVVALGLELGGDRLIALDTTVELAGGLVVRPGDVVRYDGATYTKVFDAAAAGLASGVVTDGVSTSANGYFLSFDTTVDLGGGLVVADEDVVEWDGGSFTLAFDGAAAGLDVALDVDAVQGLGGGSFLLSFDTTGEIGGVVFDDEDVMRYDGSTSAWNMEFDASAAHAAWAPADLDAVMVPEPLMAWLVTAGALGLAGLARARRR